jgi:hypothetical protein
MDISTLFSSLFFISLPLSVIKEGAEAQFYPEAVSKGRLLRLKNAADDLVANNSEAKCVVLEKGIVSHGADISNIL